MSPSGKALVSGTSIRGFKSLHPRHEISQTFWSGFFHNLEGGGLEASSGHSGVRIASGNPQGDFPMTINRQS